MHIVYHIKMMEFLFEFEINYESLTATILKINENIHFQEINMKRKEWQQPKKNGDTFKQSQLQ